MSGKPYSELGSMLERARKKKEQRQQQEKMDNRLRKKSGSAIIDRSGYVRENGLDRQDAYLYNNDREAFNAKTDNFIRNNIGKNMGGRKSINYALREAEKRGKKK